MVPEKSPLSPPLLVSQWVSPFWLPPGLTGSFLPGSSLIVSRVDAPRVDPGVSSRGEGKQRC